MDGRRQNQARQQDAEAPDDPAAEEPLLPQQPAVAVHNNNGAEHDGGRRRRRPCWRSVPWPALLGFVFLTVNSGIAIHRAQGERGAVAFVTFSYLDLLVLFGCLRRYETAEPDSAARGRLKVAVWVLTTALTILFSAKVAAVMPAAVAVVVWLVAFATVAGGFYTFFCYSDKP